LVRPFELYWFRTGSSSAGLFVLWERLITRLPDAPGPARRATCDVIEVNRSRGRDRVDAGWRARRSVRKFRDLMLERRRCLKDQLERRRALSRAADPEAHIENRCCPFCCRGWVERRLLRSHRRRGRFSGLFRFSEGSKPAKRRSSWAPGAFSPTGRRRCRCPGAAWRTSAVVAT
jgi:hypothetical protein